MSRLIIHTTSTRCIASSTLVHLGNDRVAHVLKLLHLVFKLISFGELVAVQPCDRLIDSILDLLLVTGA
ncbi:hypothetical protein HanXRQr2_Chr08g0359961 [Helianthus annuus]|uniref:Uncharacterized protein n=1 Tax=Helianthus annuus TaxID=4232 RepID=A0A9K3NEA6_HELAN|nr:hypothetical protein HanXRQr2_Chr08g0359961 [Helianthus annuus]KAJ0903295.1 hypothetical protein HanPSC8_Chr08g0347431 [Helianthus annuus]